MHSTCENCQKNVATVHLTEIVDKVPRESHLCELCAQKLSVGSKPAKAETELVITPAFEPATEVIPDELLGMKCPSCGITFHEFRVKGRLGCSGDYAYFEKGLTPLIERIQGVSPAEHRGKVPPAAEALVNVQREREQIERELKDVIRTENYERAAQLRDRLKEIIQGEEEGQDETA